MPPIFFRLLLGVAVFTLASGCVKHSTAGSAHLSPASAREIVALHEGSLALPAQSGSSRLIYVDVQENTQLAPHLTELLGSALKAGNFRLASAPSDAGYILHVTILQEGQASESSVRSAVKAGYGQKIRFSGTGDRAVMADALLVQRKVPNHSRPSRQRMKNASARNAVGSAQMRLAVFAPGDKTSLEAFSHAMAKELAQSIESKPAATTKTDKKSSKARK